MHRAACEGKGFPLMNAEEKKFHHFVMGILLIIRSL